jgi:small subunit ribosomal protein S13
MSYILGTNLNPSKKVRIGLTQIFGIGPKKALQICDKLGLSENYKVTQLTKYQIDQIIKIISQSYLIDSELLRIIQKDVKDLINIGCYRGFRHNAGLPLRGQRTHTNAKTSRRVKILRQSSKGPKGS